MRPDKDTVMMATAALWSSRSTCVIRSVGAVLADKEGRILSVGYNGVARDRLHCNEGHECISAKAGPGMDFCEAIHAEQNALLQCADTMRIHTCYTTLSPCRSCIKLLLNTSCQRIVFAIPWNDPFPERLWRSVGREWSELKTFSI